MTISESIIKWLKTFKKEKIETDALKSVTASYGLFKLPQINVKKDILGNEKRTEYYTFRVRLNSKLEPERVDNQKFMEELTEWISNQNAIRNYPVLKNGKCEEISVTTPFFVEKTENDTAIYQMTISIVYMKEANKGN